MKNLGKIEKLAHPRFTVRCILSVGLRFIVTASMHCWKSVFSLTRYVCPRFNKIYKIRHGCTFIGSKESQAIF